MDGAHKKSECNRPPRTPKHTQVNLKWIIKKTVSVGVEWIHLLQDGKQQHVLGGASNTVSHPKP